MTQAVNDGATCPVYYESRVINLNLDDATLQALDDEYELLAEEGATIEQIEKKQEGDVALGRDTRCTGYHRFSLPRHSQTL